MKISKRIGTARATILLALILVLAMPLVSFAQGRGRGRGLDRFDKCGKFVNCHDAREGRWDGRGPRGSRVGRRIRHDNDFYSGRRIRRNRVRLDRDGDGDFDRFDVLLGRRQNRIRRNSRWNR